MSTWQIFSDADNNYRWEVNKDAAATVIPFPTPIIPIHTLPLPSMSDLLLQSSTLHHLFSPPTLPQGEEHAIDNSFSFSNSLFKTGSGRKVTISSNGLVRAKTLLGLDEETVGSSITIQNPQNPKKFHAVEQESPHLQLRDSCKIMSTSVSFQSPLVGRLNNDYENRVVQQPYRGSSAGAVKQAPIKFQTAGGRSISISGDALQRARSLLGDPDLGDFFEGGDSLFSFPNKSETNTASSREISECNTPARERSECNTPAPLVHQMTPESNHYHMTKNFTYPLQPSRQMEVVKEETNKRETYIASSCERSDYNSPAPLVHQMTPESNRNQRTKSFTSPLHPSRQMEVGKEETNKRETNAASSCERSDCNPPTPLVHQMTPESNHNQRTKNFTYPLHPSRQTEFSNKFRCKGNGNNLIMKFDDVGNESDCSRKSSNTCGQKLLYDRNEVPDSTVNRSSLNGFSSRMDSRGMPLGRALVDISNSNNNTIHTNSKPPASGKRRQGALHAIVSPFKKPRSSNIYVPGDRDVENFPNDLSQLSSGASGCKRKVSTRYPFQYPRMHIKEFFAVLPFDLEQKMHFSNPIRQVTAGNAEKYMFHDGSGDNGMGAEAFVHLLAQHGASMHFASKEWVLNHYKWIVWKLACYERCHPTRCAGNFLTVSNVLEELKYRYEREVNHGHRSTIKKILEGDTLPSSTMTLCISSIHSDHVLENGTFSETQTCDQSREAVKVELTDGWYSINATLDVPLSKQRAAGKLFAGQKLRIRGAGLCGWNGPVSPLEVSSTVSLLLHINGTYRAHWAERLGFCKVAGPPLAFRCIKSNGGPIPQTLAGIIRIYPILYRERLSSGRSIVMSERTENKMMELHNQRRTAVVDGIISEYQDQEDRKGSRIYDYSNSEGAKIYNMLETAAEPEFLMADMSPEQLSSFAAYKAKLNAIKQSEMESSIEKALKDAGLGPREVTPFMKLQIVGLTYKSRQDKPKEGIVTIWNPTEKQRQELVEGKAYAIRGLIPSGSDSDILHLHNNGSSTKWLPLSSKAREQFKPFFTSRKSITLSSFSDIPLSDEFDIAALVVHVGDVCTLNEQKKQKQWVFVTDGSITHGLQSEKLIDSLLAICFWSPLIDHDSFPPINHKLAGSTVGFCNLTKKGRDHANHMWVADAHENSTYYLKFDSPHCSHLRNTASSVTRWARGSSLIIEKLKEKVLCIT